MARRSRRTSRSNVTTLPTRRALLRRAKKLLYSPSNRDHRTFMRLMDKIDAMPKPQRRTSARPSRNIRIIESPSARLARRNSLLRAKARKYLDDMHLGGWQKIFDDAKASIPSRDKPRRSVCEDRKIRREVIHATGQAGKVGQKPPLFNWKSKVRCK